MGGVHVRPWNVHVYVYACGRKPGAETGEKKRERERERVRLVSHNQRHIPNDSRFSCFSFRRRRRLSRMTRSVRWHRRQPRAIVEVADRCQISRSVWNRFVRLKLESIKIARQGFSAAFGGIHRVPGALNSQPDSLCHL